MILQQCALSGIGRQMLGVYSMLANSRDSSSLLNTVYLKC